MKLDFNSFLWVCVFLFENKWYDMKNKNIIFLESSIFAFLYVTVSIILVLKCLYFRIFYQCIFVQNSVQCWNIVLCFLFGLFASTVSHSSLTSYQYHIATSSPYQIKSSGNFFQHNYDLPLKAHLSFWSCYKSIAFHHTFAILFHGAPVILPTLFQTWMCSSF